MKKSIVVAVATAALVVPATAPAQEIPEVNCGIVSCTYVLEQRVEGVEECVEGAKRAIRYIVQGTPQPQECSL